MLGIWGTGVQIFKISKESLENVENISHSAEYPFPSILEWRTDNYNYSSHPNFALYLCLMLLTHVSQIFPIFFRGMRDIAMVPGRIISTYLPWLVQHVGPETFETARSNEVNKIEL